MARSAKQFKTALVHDESGNSAEILKQSLGEQGITVIAAADIDALHKDGTMPDLFVCVASEASVKKMSAEWGNALMHIPVSVVTAKSPASDDDSSFMQLLSHLNQHKDVMTLISGSNENNPFRNFSEEDLLNALENGEFQLWYQPVVKADTGDIRGFEALIRWKDPATGEIIFPDRFMPTIEGKEFIIPFGFWIIEEACKMLAEWNASCAYMNPLRIGINLSARQFTCSELVERIFKIIDSYKIDPSQIALEITESTFMEDMSTANIMLLTLRSKNIRIYLDDFGTGFSSLSYLLHFPVDTIKIDKSFVKWMHADEQSEEIVRSIIMLAHNLKMSVVAEGVEQQEHVDMLRAMGCDYFQGYFYAKPLCFEDATAYMQPVKKDFV
jgi:EAL domain-containing protein (putative c-di-GMP-specific phosphodiesterase class I)